MASNAVEISPALVRALVAEQFPRWSDLPIRPVEHQGWDNRTFRLGDALTVRLPSADGYIDGLVREERTLAALGPQLSISVPRVIATGAPSATFGRPWSIREWIEGQTLRAVPPLDRMTAITALADALAELQDCSTAGGPLAGHASAYRGCHVSAIGGDVQRTLADLTDERAAACWRLWREAVATVWADPPVWVHGDVAPGNMLFDGTGRLSALIDFGQTCVGDPACDLAFAWLSCSSDERDRLRDRLRVPAETWLRGAAWALWKTLITPAEGMLATYGRPRDAVLNDVANYSMR